MKKVTKMDISPIVYFKQLKNTKAWKVTSLYVRTESKGRCYTCNKVYPIEKLHAGHLIEKLGAAAIYFDLDGIRGQCYRCNRQLHGNKDIFGQKLRKEIGEERVNNLYKKSRKTKVWTKNELYLVEQNINALKGIAQFTIEVKGILKPYSK